MKIQLEEIAPNPESSFNIMVNPKLSDFYFWHFHAAFELVFIEADTGPRHVGDHISKYKGSDLVFIGSNIPHLNFDFGVKSSYEKTVLHSEPHFLENSLKKTPELRNINKLFEKSKFGIAFGETTKTNLGLRIKNLYQIDYFDQFIEIIAILNYLSLAEDTSLLHSYPVVNQYNSREQSRMKKLYQFLDEYYLRKIEIAEVAEICNLSEAAFCRFFKKMTKLTFVEFLNHYRINHAKNLLIANKNVSEACFQSGFESLSYFNRTFKKVVKMNPSAFMKTMNNNL